MVGVSFHGLDLFCCCVDQIKAAKGNDLLLLERARKIGVDLNAKEKDEVRGL